MASERKHEATDVFWQRVQASRKITIRQQREIRHSTSDPRCQSRRPAMQDAKDAVEVSKVFLWQPLPHGIHITGCSATIWMRGSVNQDET